MRTATVLMLLGLCLPAVALAQAADPRDPARSGSVDGSKPGDGAIQGGSILPGEVGGRPDPGRGSTTPTERGSRCMELSGTLREQCLLDEQRAASSGRSPSPGGSGSSAGTSAPPIDPPPQRPR